VHRFKSQSEQYITACCRSHISHMTPYDEGDGDCDGDGDSEEGEMEEDMLLEDNETSQRPQWQVETMRQDRGPDRRTDTRQ
jgi:hypothetical protein